MTMSNTLAKPILFVDIDGVLNPFAGACPEGFREVDLLPDDDEPVRICPLHAAWLTELTVSFDLVWATSWNEHERDLLKQALDYPEFAGAAAMPPSPFPPENKVDGVSTIAVKSAVAWIDDLVTDRARIWAASRTEPTILLEADPRTGMTRKHVDKLLAWASALSV